MSKKTDDSLLPEIQACYLDLIALEEAEDAGADRSELYRRLTELQAKVDSIGQALEAKWQDLEARKREFGDTVRALGVDDAEH